MSSRLIGTWLIQDEWMFKMASSSSIAPSRTSSTSWARARELIELRWRVARAHGGPEQRQREEDMPEEREDDVVVAGAAGVLNGCHQVLPLRYVAALFFWWSTIEVLEYHHDDVVGHQLSQGRRRRAESQRAAAFWSRCPAG